MSQPQKTIVTLNEENFIRLDETQHSAEDLLDRHDKYKITAMIAEGGMACVFHAKDKNCRRQVALKIIKHERQGQPEFTHRFIEEAQIAAQLDHPNILPVYDLSINQEGIPYYAMKLVKGKTLEKILSDLKTNNKETTKEYHLSKLLQIFSKICEAVSFAGSRGVVHRDLKPANIMIGEYGQVFIMDWGIAKVLSSSDILEDSAHKLEELIDSISRDDRCKTSETMHGQALGTPGFMAPEQVISSPFSIDIRTDVYALGGILYNILSLEQPHAEKDVKEIFKNKLDGIIPSLKRRNYHSKNKLNHIPGGKIPTSLIAVTQKAMALLPHQRYDSPSELQTDIEAYTNGFATEAESANQWQLFSLLFMRHRRLAFSLILLFCLIMLYMAQNYVTLQYALVAKDNAQNMADVAGTQRIMEHNSLRRLKKNQQQATILIPIITEQVRH
ncbi:MAG: serine/threonine protein kinase, partial [Lentisphaeraceae bacterium]|nr:serine/threonine protein kinase [Lentisphaeraceae bacterium]